MAIFHSLLAPFGGIPVVADPDVPEYVERWNAGKRPRSKKRRIRKKWAKRYGFMERRRVMFMVGGTLLAPDIRMLEGFTINGD